jgi:hypothetical protein
MKASACRRRRHRERPHTGHSGSYRFAESKVRFGSFRTASSLRVGDDVLLFRGSPAESYKMIIQEEGTSVHVFYFQKKGKEGRKKYCAGKTIAVK